MVTDASIGSGQSVQGGFVGGAVPRQFIPSVEKGARAQLAAGLLAGWPVTSSSTPSASAPSSPVADDRTATTASGPSRS